MFMRAMHKFQTGGINYEGLECPYADAESTCDTGACHHVVDTLFAVARGEPLRGENHGDRDAFYRSSVADACAAGPQKGAVM